MGVRWISARVSNEDLTIHESDGMGLALAGISGPTVILSLGNFRLYLIGEETLENVLGAITEAFDQDRRSRAEAG